jgi:flagellar motor component MotA
MVTESSVSFDFNLAVLLQIAEIASILCGGGLVAFGLGRTTSRVESALKMQNEMMQQQAEEITELKSEARKIADLLTAIAVQGTRLDRLEADIRDLKHGKGFISPMQVG